MKVAKMLRFISPAAVGLIVLGGCSTGAFEDSAPEPTSDQNLAEYKNTLEEAMQPKSEWEGPDSTPTPPDDISLAIVSCSGLVSGCANQADGMARAAKDLGWTTVIYDGQGSPSAQNQAVIQAVNSGADAILLAATDRALVQSGLEAAAKKEVPVGSTGIFVPPGDGIAFDVSADYDYWGEVMGSWIIDDSDGTAVALPTIDESFTSTVAIVESAIATVHSCSECTLLPTEHFVPDDIGGQLGPRIASVLRRDADVDYVIGAYDSAIEPMVPAIKNVRLDNRITIVGNVGSPANLQYIVDHEVQAATVAQDDEYLGYAAVDQMIRELTDEPLWKTPGETDDRFMFSEATPSRLLTAENIEDPSKPWKAENNAAAHFRELWGAAS